MTMAQQIVSFVLLSCIVLFIGRQQSFADVYTESMFPDATRSASNLDLILLQREMAWRGIFLDKECGRICQKYPLVARSKVSAYLKYFGKDKINITAWIIDTKSFLSLSYHERKMLVKEIHRSVVDVALGFDLMTIKSGKLDFVEMNDVEITVILNDSGTVCRLVLPDHPVGQAAFARGHYMFSEYFYLNLMDVESCDYDAEFDKKKGFVVYEKLE